MRKTQINSSTNYQYGTNPGWTTVTLLKNQDQDTEKSFEGLLVFQPFSAPATLTNSNGDAGKLQTGNLIDPVVPIYKDLILNPKIIRCVTTRDEQKTFNGENEKSNEPRKKPFAA